MPIRQMSVDRFVRLLVADRPHPAPYVFFLGAGCSVSSGVPAAGDLVRHVWLPRLRDQEHPHAVDLDAWVANRFPAYDPSRPAMFYGEVMDALLPSSGDRQQEIENLCSGKLPSFGYATMATLMATKAPRFNVALTTNFDDLLEDALQIFTRTRPLVIPHESLTGFIRREARRPLVVKLHGDNRLAPLNTADERRLLSDATVAAVRDLLRGSGLIFLGYGGDDQGIRQMFESLPSDVPSHGIYWLSSSEPSGLLQDWFATHNGIWVKHRDFDELMVLVKDQFGLPHADMWRLEETARAYDVTYRRMSNRIRHLSDTSPSTLALQEAIERSNEALPGWWIVESMAETYKINDPNTAQQIYLNGIEQFPHAAPLLGNYANFLKDVLRDFDGARAMYERAEQADPLNAIVLGDFGVFLKQVDRDFDRAEDYYRRSFAADPQYAVTLRNYAIFLRQVRHDDDRAESFIARSFAADPFDPKTVGEYATILWAVRGQNDRAEELFRRAFELDPNDAEIIFFFATFLADARGNYPAAIEMFERGVALAGPRHRLVGNFAYFLWQDGRDLDQAERYFRIGIEEEPEGPGKVGYLLNYANFLRLERGDITGAADLYRQAIETDPSSARAKASLALLLRDRPEELEHVGQLLDDAERLAPDDPQVLQALGIYTDQIVHDYERASQYYIRAAEANPEDLNNKCNLTGVLFTLGQDDSARALLEELLRQSHEDDFSEQALETWLYAFLFGVDDDRMTKLARVRRILEHGTRSRGWDLSASVQRAVVNGHPHQEWIGKLADVVVGNSELEVLTDWQCWREAEVGRFPVGNRHARSSNQ